MPSGLPVHWEPFDQIQALTVAKKSLESAEKALNQTDPKLEPIQTKIFQEMTRIFQEIKKINKTPLPLQLEAHQSINQLNTACDILGEAVGAKTPEETRHHIIAAIDQITETIEHYNYFLWDTGAKAALKDWDAGRVKASLEFAAEALRINHPNLQAIQSRISKEMHKIDNLPILHPNLKFVYNRLDEAHKNLGEAIKAKTPEEIRYFITAAIEEINETIPICSKFINHALQHPKKLDTRLEPSKIRGKKAERQEAREEQAVRSTPSKTEGREGQVSPSPPSKIEAEVQEAPSSTAETEAASFSSQDKDIKHLSFFHPSIDRETAKKLITDAIGKNPYLVISLKAEDEDEALSNSYELIIHGPRGPEQIVFTSDPENGSVMRYVGDTFPPTIRPYTSIQALIGSKELKDRCETPIPSENPVIIYLKQVQKDLKELQDNIGLAIRHVYSPKVLQSIEAAMKKINNVPQHIRKELAERLNGAHNSLEQIDIDDPDPSAQVNDAINSIQTAIDKFNEFNSEKGN